MNRKELRRRCGLALPVTFLLFVALCGVWPGLLATHDPLKTHYDRTFELPSSEFWLGTDQYGRDIYSRLVYGSRITTMIGFGSLAISVLLGVPLGLLAAWYKGIPDMVVMRGMDLLMVFPPIFVGIVAITFLGAGLSSLIAVIGFLYVPRFARVAYSAAKEVSEESYIEAARAIGQTDIAILLRHILPNIAATVTVQAGVSLAFMILLAAGLNFLGLGVPPPTPSWGLMVGEARRYLTINGGILIVWPSTFIVLVILSINAISDQLSSRRSRV